MSDSQYTRVVRLRADADPSHARNDGTRFARTGQFARVVLVDHRHLFNHHQRRLRQLLRDYPRPGLAVFALHHDNGIAGHLWLEATDKLRAGTIGRHGKVDLFLQDDEELSLRHLLVLVKRTAGGLRLRVADLATPAGFQAEEGGSLRAVDANGTLVFRAASYSFIAVPTGEPLPWNPDVEDPWATLPPRVLVDAQERGARPPPRRRERAETAVSAIAGPAEYGPEPAVEAGEASRGYLFIANGGNEERLTVGAKAVGRGLILGRYSRCSGDTGAMSDEVSRVHAVVMAIDDEVHLIDAGSTNGVFTGNEADEVEVKCSSIRPGTIYRMGRMRVRWEPAQ